MGKTGNVDDIRKWMKELQSERYAIENAALQDLEEYVKHLYLTVLCTVVQYHNEQTEGQMLLLKRIISGMGVEENVTEYMRKALEINETQMQEFRSMVGDGDTKYYFAIDALLLAALGSGEKDTYEYLAELLELLNISKRDLECLCTVAKAIVMQDGAVYDEAKEMMGEQIREADFSAYLCSFYEGAVIDSNELVCYHAPNRETATEVKPRVEFLENKVMFINMKLRCEEDWKFQGNELVVFENCIVLGGKASIRLNGCKRVEMKGCSFSNFTRPVLFEEGKGEVLIDNCEFENCIYECYITAEYSHYSAAVGGVICSNESWNSANNMKNYILNSDFRNCGVKNQANNNPKSFISDCECVVKNNRFYKCKGWRTFQGKLDEDENGQLFSNCIEHTNNQRIESGRCLCYKC